MERRLWVVLAWASVVFFLGLGTPQLFDEDEPKNAECGREMFVRGDWLVPTFNEELRTDKPILIYWLMLTSYHLFGVTEFAARFWSAVLGVGTCLLTFGIGRRLFTARIGMWAGLMLATTLMFTTIARASTPDSTLIFFTTLSLFLFVRFGQLNSDAADWREILPRSRWGFIAIYSAMAMAVLAKGPVGVLLPCVVIGCFLYVSCVMSRSQDELDDLGVSFGSRWQRRIGRWIRPGDFFRIVWSMRPFCAILCLVVIALPWYIAVGIKTHGAWLEGFLGQHNVGRFLRSMEGHRGPVVYYPIAILIGFFPWSVFCLPVLKSVGKRLRKSSAEPKGFLFLVSWFLVYLVFFTCARTKLPNYVLPCYPAIALMTAFWFERSSEEILFRRDFTWAAWSLAAAGIVMAIGLGIASRLLLPGETVLATLGAVPIIGGVATWQAVKRFGTAAGRFAFAGSALIFVLAVFVWAAPRISRHQDGAYLAEQIRRRDAETAPIATYNYFAPGLVFYAKRPIDRCRIPAEISEVLSKPGGLIITRADRLEELQSQLPAGTEILARRQRFLRQHDIVILGRSLPPAIPMALHGSRKETAER